MRDVLLVLAVFSACVVESGEALTVVLAVGAVRLLVGGLLMVFGR